MGSFSFAFREVLPPWVSLTLESDDARKRDDSKVIFFLTE